MKPKIYYKSLDLAVKLFPSAYSNRQKYRTFHFAFLWKRGRLLSMGVNSPNKPDMKALWFAQKYNVNDKKKFPYLHAEIDAISKLFGRYHVDSSLKMVVIRLNKNFEEQNSKPCSSCQVVLDALGINKVYFSESNK